MTINAKGVHYKDLNDKINELIQNKDKEIILNNVNGQRYIADGLTGKDIKIIINGIPGNDLSAFMDGPTIIVHSNCQDGIGNTMNSGKIIVNGSAGDIVGHSMRGGKIYIKGDAGYRVGIHMKAYRESYPVIIIGGTAQNFLGEYMAGGLIIVLGLNITKQSQIVGNYVGTGMHGGEMFIRGDVMDYQLGREVKIFDLTKDDNEKLRIYIKEYCDDFKIDINEILKKKFIKLIPFTHRPYGKLYAY